MHTFFVHIIDALFPPSDDARIVRALTEHDISLLYSSTSVDDVCALSSYKDRRIRALVHEAKFQKNKRAISLLSVLFQKHHEKVTFGDHIIIPIPLSSRRLRSRGYNQVHEILKALPHSSELNVRTDILKRIKHTSPQTEHERQTRLKNVRDAFSVAHVDAIIGKHLILVDDVVTTGATLIAAKIALAKHHPASITCIALAH